jgi:hypothetical protein
MSRAGSGTGSAALAVPSSKEREQRAGEPEREVISPSTIALSSDSLSRQLDVLRRMRSALADQQGAQALSLYRENEGWFRGQPLEPEARAALVAALCQVGLRDEALRESERFQRTFQPR